jgi:hypothetical protein
MSKLWLEYLPSLKGTTFYRENTRGYVNDKGELEEPPLKALSLEESKKRFDKNAKQETVENCEDGLCNI